MRLLLVRGFLPLGATRISTPQRGRRRRPFAIRLLTRIRALLALLVEGTAGITGGPVDCLRVVGTGML